MARVKECRFKIYKNYITGCTYFRRQKHCSIYFQLCVCVNLPFFQVSLSMVSTIVTIFSEQIAYFRHPPACVSSDLRWWQTNILTEIFNTVFPSFVPPPSARLRTRYIKLFRLYSPLNISCLGSTSGLTNVRPRELLHINLVWTLHAVCSTSVWYFLRGNQHL